MKKLFTVFSMMLLVVSTLGIVMALKPDFSPHTVIPSEGRAIVPQTAFEVTDGVFDLGVAIDVDGQIVQGFLYTYKQENAKPSWAGSEGGEKCYTYLAKGARWKVTEDYVIASDVNVSMIELSMESWDEQISFEIFGVNNLSQVVDGDDLVSPDGKNEVLRKSLTEENIIAYAVVWGIFSGNPHERRIVEWDIVFNSNFNFGDATVDLNVMDYQNIATHELGHAAGMDHSGSCTEETMYASASLGETKKRTLNNGDIEGLRNLY